MLLAFRVGRFAKRALVGTLVLGASALLGCAGDPTSENEDQAVEAMTPEETVDGILTKQRMKSFAPTLTGVAAWDLAAVHRDREKYLVAIGYAADGTAVREIVMHQKDGIVVRSADPSGLSLAVTQAELRAYGDDFKKLMEAAPIFACADGFAWASAILGSTLTIFAGVTLSASTVCVGTFYIPLVGEVTCGTAALAGSATAVAAIGVSSIGLARMVRCQRQALR